MARTSRVLVPRVVAAVIGAIGGGAVVTREPRVVAGRALPVAATAPPVVEAITLQAPETKPDTASETLPPKAARSKPMARRKPVEPVIPLVHAPDDPGPDPGPDGDPRPEMSASRENDGWQRLRRLFR